MQPCGGPLPLILLTVPFCSLFPACCSSSFVRNCVPSSRLLTCALVHALSLCLFVVISEAGIFRVGNRRKQVWHWAWHLVFRATSVSRENENYKHVLCAKQSVCRCVKKNRWFDTKTYSVCADIKTLCYTHTHTHTHAHTRIGLLSIHLGSLIRLGIINGGPVSQADSGVTLSLIPFSDNFIWPDAIVIAPVLDVYRKQ